MVFYYYSLSNFASNMGSGQQAAGTGGGGGPAGGGGGPAGGGGDMFTNLL